MPTTPPKTPPPPSMPPPSVPLKDDAKSTASSKRTEVDPKLLTAEDAQKRCAAIYKLEKKINGKRAVYDISKRAAKTAKDALEVAEEALAKEIEEQRFGPGPLFDELGTEPRNI